MEDNFSKLTVKNRLQQIRSEQMVDQLSQRCWDFLGAAATRTMTIECVRVSCVHQIVHFFYSDVRTWVTRYFSLLSTTQDPYLEYDISTNHILLVSNWFISWKPEPLSLGHLICPQIVKYYASPCATYSNNNGRFDCPVPEGESGLLEHPPCLTPDTFCQ